MTEDEKAEAVVDGLAGTFCDCQGTLPLYPTTEGWHCNRCDRICNRCATPLPAEHHWAAKSNYKGVGWWI